MIVYGVVDASGNVNVHRAISNRIIENTPVYEVLPVDDKLYVYLDDDNTITDISDVYDRRALEVILNTEPSDSIQLDVDDYTIDKMADIIFKRFAQNDEQTKYLRKVFQMDRDDEKPFIECIGNAIVGLQYYEAIEEFIREKTA